VKPDLQSGAAGPRCGGLAKFVCSRWGCGAPIAASVHAVHHGRTVHHCRSGQRPKSIALDSFPVARTEWKNAQALEEFSLVQEVIVALRNIRGGNERADAKKKVAAEFSKL